VEEQAETYRPMAGPEKGTDVEVQVTGLSAERLGEAVDLLARCFYANPDFVGLVQDQRTRSRVLPCVFAAGLRDAKGRARAER
jgi:hypothetical protein